MAKHLVELLGIAGSVLLTPLALGQNSGSASFGDVYGPYANTTQARIDNTYAIRGQFYAQSSTSTNLSNGSLSVPNSFYLAGNGSYLMLPVTFTPNGAGGGISGSITTNYTCSGSCTQSNLSVTVNSNGTSYTGAATAGVKYEILSILYTPPGNASNNGFSNSISQGESISTSDDFSTTDSISFKGGTPISNNSVTFTSSIDGGTGSTSSLNSQATGGAQLNAVSQAIDHNQDQIFLLIDPSVTVTQTGPNSGDVFVGGSLDATGNFGPNGAPNDIINVNIAGLKNPPSIPVEILQDQTLGSGQTLPGLRYVCANPLPSNQCTQQNACGCTAADFAPIVAQDELANDTVQSTPLDSIDNKRYVYINNINLQGPDQQGAAPVKYNFSLTDSAMSGETTTVGSSYGVSYSHGFQGKGFGFSLDITATTGFTFKQSQTAGVTNGSAHTGSVTLGTNDAGCFEYVNVYEDTIYHTFAFSLPQPAPANCQ